METHCFGLLYFFLLLANLWLDHLSALATICFLLTYSRQRRPRVAVPTMSLCLHSNSTTERAWCTFHFLLVLMAIPALLSFSYLLSLMGIACRTFVILHSSTIDVKCIPAACFLCCREQRYLNFELDWGICEWNYWLFSLVSQLWLKENRKRKVAKFVSAVFCAGSTTL